MWQHADAPLLISLSICILHCTEYFARSYYSYFYFSNCFIDNLMMAWFVFGSLCKNNINLGSSPLPTYYTCLSELQSDVFSASCWALHSFTVTWSLICQLWKWLAADLANHLPALAEGASSLQILLPDSVTVLKLNVYKTWLPFLAYFQLNEYSLYFTV